MTSETGALYREKYSTIASLGGRKHEWLVTSKNNIKCLKCGLNIEFGQIKVPYNYEKIVFSDCNQLIIDGHCGYLSQPYGRLVSASKRVQLPFLFMSCRDVFLPELISKRQGCFVVEFHMLKTDHVANKQQDNKYDEHKARDPLLEQQVKPGFNQVLIDLVEFLQMLHRSTVCMTQTANNQRLNNDLKSQDKSIKKKLNYDEDNEPTRIYTKERNKKLDMYTHAKKEDEITYAELCFPPNAESRKIISKESPTEYAKIVVKKKMPETPKDDGQGSAGEGETSSQSSDGHSQESPLICIHIESSV
ncbi:hypothetical protein GQR58_026579 [Nymphon striatum]|nr:hypothetical protein GQR58_026579 [Nymphon striatum]